MRGEMKMATSTSRSCFSTERKSAPTNGMSPKKGMRVTLSTVCRCINPPMAIVWPSRTSTLVDTCLRLMIGKVVELLCAVSLHWCEYLR